MVDGYGHAFEVVSLVEFEMAGVPEIVQVSGLAQFPHEVVLEKPAFARSGKGCDPQLVLHDFATAPRDHSSKPTNRLGLFEDRASCDARRRA